MIVKNGEIIAIGKVKHDNTLSGTGQPESPLGVNGSILKNAGDWITVTGKYPNYTYNKKAGNIPFNNGTLLSADSVYMVVTDVYFTPSAATPSWYDMSIDVGNQTYGFTIDGTNTGMQTYSFTQIENVGSSDKTLKITPHFDAIGNANIVQSIHNIVSVGGGSSGPIPPTPVDYSTIPFEFEDMDNAETMSVNILYQDGE